TDGDRIVAYAVGGLQRGGKDRDRAFELLEPLARNSLHLTGDPPGMYRPMLEEIRPDLSVPVLVAISQDNDGEAAVKAIQLLSHLRDADERANRAIIEALASEDSNIADAARTSLSRPWRASTTVKRLPPPPIDRGGSSMTPPGVPPGASLEVQVLAAFGAR